MVHISQIYDCTKVTLSAELLYLCELGKYLSKYNETLSLDGVVYSHLIQRSPHLNYVKMAIANGWIVNCNLDLDNIIDYTDNTIVNLELTDKEVPYSSEDYNKRKNDLKYNYMTPIKKQIVFNRYDDVACVITLDGNPNISSGHTINSLVFKTKENVSQIAWISVLAKVVIDRFMNGKPKLVLIEINSALARTNATVYLWLLYSETNVFADWMKIGFETRRLDNGTEQILVEDKDRNNLTYLTWYQQGKDMGYLTRTFTKEEKMLKLNKLNIKEGDIVLLYERDRMQEKNAIKGISGCFISKLVKIENGIFTFELILTKRTYAQARYYFETRNEDVKKLYHSKVPYDKLATKKLNLDIIDLGIEFCMYKELYFILPLSSADETWKNILVHDDRVAYSKDNLYSINYMSQNDFIYWVLEDYNYDYNVQRFLDLNFGDKIPMRDLFYQGALNNNTFRYSNFYKDEVDNYFAD